MTLVVIRSKFIIVDRNGLLLRWSHFSGESRLREGIVKILLKRFIRRSAHDHLAFDAVARTLADNERGRSRDPCGVSFCYILLDRRSIRIVPDARAKAIQVEPELARIFVDRFGSEVVGVRDKRVAHLPEPRLLSSALRRYRSTHRIRVKVERKVAADKSNLASVDVILFKTIEDSGLELLAKWTL